MNFNDYQEKSRETWLFNYKNDEVRAYLGLGDEAGEVQGKYKKFLRGDTNKLSSEEMKKELGDVLYYIARIADYNNITLQDIANANVKKLQDRKKRGVIKGTGDHR